MLEGPINGFWLSPSAGINIEFRSVSWWLGKNREGAVLCLDGHGAPSLVCWCSPIKQPVTLKMHTLYHLVVIKVKYILSSAPLLLYFP